MVLITREDNIKPTRTTKKKIILISVLGLIFVTISVISMATDPLLLIIKYCTRVSDNSVIFNIFQTEVEGARISLYIFNITNSERFMSGEDNKLKVQEVGPFTYVETRQNIVLGLDSNAHLLRFTPRTKLKFLPDESIARPEDVDVTVANIVSLSATSLLSTYPFWIQQGFNLVYQKYNTKSIVNMDVHSYLWGYENPFISLANALAPGLIYFNKLGIMDRLYDNKTLYQMELSTSDGDRFSIKTLKKYIREDNWEENTPLESYTFNDTYEGAAYFPDIKQNSPLNIYRMGVCKTFELGFVGKQHMDFGSEGWIYKITNKTFTRDCENGQGICGLLDLSPCLFGIPIAISRTHFLHSNQKLLERIEGLNPDEKIHDSDFIIDPKIGFELSTTLSLQLNLALGDISFNAEAKPFSDLVTPIVYIKVAQPKLIDDIKHVLKFLHIFAPIIVLCLEILLFVIGIVLLAHAVKLTILNSHIYTKTSQIVTKSNTILLPLISSHKS